MTKERASANARDMSDESVYDHLLRIHNLTRAAEMLADNFDPLSMHGSPPILHLLEMANDEFEVLANRIGG
ncbi:hypothetical protein KBY28_05145 [Ruegeria pomeroyi]|uniref:hypothetical protein n=1 Tax=Ruegeria pomeroyi TaxID=89184 RepID=UPI001F41AB24|nr:hypothetical protein [Ruegeria pomeroyi]MCE8507835.1 hypothetical protein [Ruegeria pomeroyi]